MSVDRGRKNSASRDKQRKLLIALLESHLASMSKGSLVLAACLKSQRAFLDEFKTLEGWDFEAPEQHALFGDAGLFQTHEMHLTERKPTGGVQ